jgi:predicted metal-dependent HD superfamily phosphohydrolase
MLGKGTEITSRESKKKEKKGHTLEHIQHALRDNKTTRDVHKSQQDRQGAEGLGDGMRDESSAHDEEASNADHACRIKNQQMSQGCTTFS